MRIRLVAALAAFGAMIAAAVAVAASTPAPKPAPAPAPAPPAEAPRLSAGQPIPPDELDALVDGVVRQAMTRDRIAGLSVAIVQDGQVVLKKGYGVAAPGRQVDPDTTLFRIASISKTFTWITAMKEVEAGRMRLDAPINTYLPANLALPDAGGWRQIELRDLMTHTPGLEDRILDHLFVGDPARVRALATQLRLARPRRVFAPGVIPAYSNYGAALTGEAVSNLEGGDFQDVVEREIIGPLGMAHTTCREPYPARAGLPAPMSPALAALRSTGYRLNGVDLEPQRYEFVTQGAPAGAGSSTAGDMARYMMMILNDGSLDGRTIYGPVAARAFRTPLQTFAPGVDSTAAGFFVFHLPGGFAGYGHDGDTVWFHSSMVTIPELKLGVFVTTNTDTGGAVVHDLPIRVVEHFYAGPPKPLLPGAPALGRQRAVYAGTYLSDRRPTWGLEQFVYMLIGQWNVSVTDDGRLLAPGDDGQMTAWTPDGPAGTFRSVDGRQTTAFRLEGGRAVRLYASNGIISADRVGPLHDRSVLGMVGGAALIAVLATLIGPAIRWRRELPQAGLQATANVVQIAAVLAWLAALLGLAVFGMNASNQAELLYAWPGKSLLAFSAFALIATLLSGASLLLAPFAWRPKDGWPLWRKLRFTLTGLILTAFGVQLAFWGALQPWAA
jgi:CubicO group peptidase (beta-lactamase class C family)